MTESVEADRAVVRVSMLEWQRRSHESDPALTRARIDLAGGIPKEAARALTKSGRIEVWDLKDGVAIRTTSWVGSIRLGGLQIDVRPKIQGLVLGRILRYALGRKALDGGVHVSTALGSHGLVELLVLQLVEEARVLVRGGLRRGYVSRAEDLLFPRGRIDFHRWASLPRASGAGLPCRFHERSSNVLQNQALLAGLRLGAQLCAGLGAGWEAAETARLLDAEVEEVRLSPETFERLLREGTRMTRAYDPALFLVQMLAEGVSAASDTNDKSARVRGFLLNMNVIFQALLGRFLAEELVDKQVTLEPHITGFFTWDDDASRTPPFLNADSGDGERRFRRKVSIDSGHGEHSSERSDGEPGGDALLSSSDSTGGLRCPSPVSSPVCVSQ